MGRRRGSEPLHSGQADELAVLVVVEHGGAQAGLDAVGPQWASPSTPRPASSRTTGRFGLAIVCMPLLLTATTVGVAAVIPRP
jgi:hypothetical protein